jgi:hypothetical protein
MTVCGLLRLDGADVRRSTLTAMLAASSLGLPAVRGVHLDGPFGVVAAAGRDGDPLPPIAVDDAGLAVVVLTARPARRLLVAARPAPGPRPWAGRAPGAGGAPAGHDHAGADPDGRGGCTVACHIAAAYRAAGEHCLRGLPPDKLVVVWDPAARRLLAARTGRLAADLLTWSDGGHVVFGTEPAHLTAAFRPPLLAPAPRPAGLAGETPVARLRPGLAPGTGLDLVGTARPRRLARVRQLAPGDRVSVSVSAARRVLRSPRAASLRLVPRPPEPPLPVEPSPG